MGTIKRSGLSPAEVHARPAVVTLLVALLAVVLLFSSRPAAAQDMPVFFQTPGEVELLKMTPSTTTTIRTIVGFGDLVVGNSAIADVMPLTSASFYVIAKQSGRTNISVYDPDRNLLGVIDVVVGLDTTEVLAAIADVAPYAEVRVTVVNNRIRLSGTVADGLTLRNVLEVAQQFSDQPIINTIRVTNAQQVMLEVRFIEANRTAGRELGVSWAASDGPRRGAIFGVATTPRNTNPSVGGFGGVASTPILGGAQPFGAIVANVLDSGISVDVMVRALEDKGLVRRLAEPNLTAMSGETASFHAGGEFPIPIVDADGNQSTTFKPYGIRLSFTPVVLDKGLINLKLEPEVSDIDPALSVDGVPALVTRRTETTVELYSGQSFAISGLLQQTSHRVQSQLPWVGQVPVLGALFRSSSFHKRESDLVVIVTPHLVRPARPGEPLRTPLDRTRGANDAEFFLLGLTEVTPGMIKKFETGTGIAPFGHIIDIKE